MIVKGTAHAEMLAIWLLKFKLQIFKKPVGVSEFGYKMHAPVNDDDVLFIFNVLNAFI